MYVCLLFNFYLDWVLEVSTEMMVVNVVGALGENIDRDSIRQWQEVREREGEKKNFPYFYFLFLLFLTKNGREFLFLFQIPLAKRGIRRYRPLIESYPIFMIFKKKLVGCCLGPKPMDRRRVAEWKLRKCLTKAWNMETSEKMLVGALNLF